QSPLISVPRKTTSDVDWAGPIRSVIAHSYGEDPNNYNEECSVLHRCRQDAVKGAGSDQTARDLLYKYFGQLELLELRFAEIKIAFPWQVPFTLVTNDAFTGKLTTQTSLAFEKASIIHLLASVLSCLAATSSRADPEGVKRAYYNSRAAAGMLTYINENFLHAPSTDLSREVVHLLVGIMMAQATEIFTEKLVDEKKAPALVARSANQAASMYSALVEEMKEFQGKGVFDRHWFHVLQIKSKLFASLAQYYRATADTASNKHGSAVVRLKLADMLAQDAKSQASSFAYVFVSSATPTLPHDAGTSLQEICKAHAALCAESKTQAVKDNDLVYHDILPSESTLAQIEKLPPAAPVTIQEVYGNQEVSKLIGPDIFIRLIPLAVHESASVYSEEKAKLVRGEVERVDLSEVEVRAGLEHAGLPGLVSVWRKMIDDESEDSEQVDISGSLRRLSQYVRDGGSTENLMKNLENERERCERELRELSGLLENESRECERMRAKYAPNFTQSPSGPQTTHFRSTISSNLGALSSAASSDANLSALWQSVQPKITVLASGEAALERTAADVASGRSAAQVPVPVMSLLDLRDEEPISHGLVGEEKEELKKAIGEATEKLDRLGKIRRERDEVLKDLKDKVQNDDVSSLLLLNRRTQDVEPQLFASELEKFRPYQGRLASAVQASRSTLQELQMLVSQVESGKGVKERQRSSRQRSKRIREWEQKIESAGETYTEIRGGVAKGMSYYESLSRIIDNLRKEIKSFVLSREAERNRMISEIETRQRLGGSPPPLPSHSDRGIDTQLSNLSLGSSSYTPSPQPMMYGSTPTLPPPPQAPTPRFPSPPRGPAGYPSPPTHPPNTSSPYDFSSLSNLPAAFSTTPSGQPPMPPRPAAGPPQP
ncbi:hypothetical protein TREMEDRAFT_20787, partial [Tremella mesenterica DSM 1558]|uniref:uncharacterized protein n=1 Tax=Tremella mesenterica (strain ATCC 24925 / CBS 8224 / DSM 1558 / NBRC 9311 / NRRL Y-6157 / RJB 2259-6 / UBC 559-6) TaxID=578456 RepID=UPI0003F4A1AC